jgi:hypothetical protein
VLTGPRGAPNSTGWARIEHLADRVERPDRAGSRGWETSAEHPFRPAEHVAGDLAYALCREEWKRAAHTEQVSAHQLGYLARGRGRASKLRPAKVPLLRMVVEPGGSIDFAHPDLGFPGHQCRPPAERTFEAVGGWPVERQPGR